MTWIIYNTSTLAVRMLDHSSEAPSAPTGCTVSSLSGATAWPTAPTPTSVLHFSGGAMEWRDSRSLSGARVLRIASLEAARDVEVFSPLTVGSTGTFVATLLGQAFIQGAVLKLQTMSSRSDPRTVTFTLADDTQVTLNKTQTEDVGLALAARTQTAFDTMVSLRAAVGAATTIAAVDAIVWPR